MSWFLNGAIKSDNEILQMLGYSSTSTDLKGTQTTTYPTSNQSGYPIQSNDPKIIKGITGTDPGTNLKESVTLPATGNITGWPVGVTNNATGESGVIPGYAENGSITYDKSGIPHYNPYNIKKSYNPMYGDLNYSNNNVKSPSVSEVSSPKAPTTSSNNDLLSANNSQSRKRQQGLFDNSFLNDLLK